MDERLVEAAQALLTGYDTALSRQWREEERRWRLEDLQWRGKERTYADAEAAFMWVLEDHSTSQGAVVSIACWQAGGCKAIAQLVCVAAG